MIGRNNSRGRTNGPLTNLSGGSLPAIGGFGLERWTLVSLREALEPLVIGRGIAAELSVKPTAAADTAGVAQPLESQPASASGGPLGGDDHNPFMSEGPESVVRDYYDALRNGDPLEPYFLADESTVKFGLSEALFGESEVSDALQEQTETTTEWAVESRSLTVTDRDGAATFADEVTMAWTDIESGERRRFETRWSGTLVRLEEEPTRAGEHEWQFATMHVSTAEDL